MSRSVCARRAAWFVVAALLAATSFESVADGGVSPPERNVEFAALGGDDPILMVDRLLTAAPAGSEPFALPTAKLSRGGLWSKWRGVEDRIRAETEIIARCRAQPDACESPAAQRFIAIIDAARARQGRARIGEINRAINLAIRPVSDLVQHGVIDRWTAPLATLAAGRGDCEDYAIAKFVALREAGLPEADVRLLILHEPATQQDHAVVAVQLEAQWLVLENRHFRLVEIEQVRSKPLFVLRHDDVRTFAVSISGREKITEAMPANAAPVLGPSGVNIAPLLI
jgi:predicted transglutaminase-like cysteine proteinase